MNSTPEENANEKYNLSETDKNNLVEIFDKYKYQAIPKQFIIDLLTENSKLKEEVSSWKKQAKISVKALESTCESHNYIFDKIKKLLPTSK